MENSERDGNARPPDLPLEKPVYAGQEATVRTGHGTTDWFQIGRSEEHTSELQSPTHICMPSSAWRSTLFPYTTLFRSCMQVRKQQLELDMEQQTCSK